MEEQEKLKTMTEEEEVVVAKHAVQAEAAEAMDPARLLLEQAGKRRKRRKRRKRKVPKSSSLRSSRSSRGARAGRTQKLYVVCVLPEKCWIIGRFRVLCCLVRQWPHVHTSVCRLL